MGIKERKERDFKKREEKILEAAKKIFLKAGTLHATMDMIAKEVEIGRSTLYLHFKNKDEMMAKILSEWYKDLRASLSEKDKFEFTVEQMRFIIRQYLNYCITNPDEYFLHKALESSLQKENLSKKILKELEDERKKRIELLEKVYHKARVEGLVGNTPVYFLVGTAWGMLRGAIDVVIENHFAKEISDKEKFFQFVEKVFFDGILLKENSNGKRA